MDIIRLLWLHVLFGTLETALSPDLGSILQLAKS